jgi:hypothetical protein
LAEDADPKIRGAIETAIDEAKAARKAAWAEQRAETEQALAEGPERDRGRSR